MYKRRILSLMISIAIVLTSCISVYAEDSNSTAKMTVEEKTQKLNSLGIIAGDGKGNYNLSSKLLRSEAATIIVNLLGMDTYIKSNKDKYKQTSYKDVKSTDWFVYNVSYCEQNNIMSGIGNSKFGPNLYISEKAILAMMMRVLGYNENTGDFDWNTVYSKAYEIGLVEDTKYETQVDDNTDYLRSDVMEVIYKALSLNIKNETYSLLQRLVNSELKDHKTAYDSGLLKDTIFAQINEITTLSDTRISVMFNEYISGLSTSSIEIYEKDKRSIRLKAELMLQQDKKITIKTEKQQPNKEYVVEVVGGVDNEDNRSKLISDSFKGYTPIKVVSDFFKISSIESVGRSEIKVYFTHPINENSEIASYYSITENGNPFIQGTSSNLNVNLLEYQNNGITITLKDKVFNPENEYKLSVSGKLISTYGTNLYDGLGDEIIFIPNDKVDQSLDVETISSTSNNTVQLNFNREINPVLAQQVFNYYITDWNNNPIQIKKATLMDSINGKGKSVTLTLGSTLEKLKNYNLMINNLNDITKQYKIEEKLYTFNGNYPDYVEFKVSNISVVDAGTIIINFNKGIDEISATDISSYTIQEMGSTYRSFQPDNIYFSKENPQQVKLYFKSDKALKGGVQYGIRIYPSFKDYTGTNINKLIDYNFVPNNIVKAIPMIAKSVIISKDSIKISFFNKDISLNSPNSSAQNYFLEYTVNGENIKKVPIAVTYIDTSNIILKFDLLDYTQTYTIKCKTIKDYAGETWAEPDKLKSVVIMGE